MSVIRTTNDICYWAGDYSRCNVGGVMANYIAEAVQKFKMPISLMINNSDGIVSDADYVRLTSSTGTPPGLTYNTQCTAVEGLRKPETLPIIATLCSRNVHRFNLIHIPLDDDTFQHGLEHVLSNAVHPKWEEKQSVAFWRGGASGFERPSVRVRVAAELFGHPNTDVGITKWANWEGSQNIPEQLFVPRCSIEHHLKYKYILIVDGNCIASNLQWVFGSGSVPILVTHPENCFWFESHLKPMVNYVPIKYNLSDLKEKIDWLVAHDDEAKQIAENALRLSRRIFTPQYQRKYIDSTIGSIVYNAPQSHLELMYKQKRAIASDINEHLETLHTYAKKCESVVECGVRAVVSSYAFASGLSGKPNNSFTMIDLFKSDQIDGFLDMCENEGVHANFVVGSDTTCEPISTDLLFIDTWHVYGHLKRELAHWHTSVKKYIILHDTTVDEIYGESIRERMDIPKQSLESGYPEHEIRIGLWPAVVEFLEDHPEWEIEKRYTHNNGLTILRRKGI